MAERIADKFAAWERESEARFQKLKANEEELNRIFIGLYGLQNELTPEIADRDVTVRRADRTREIKSLISYAVGCLFGRYSPDADGICYAGGEWDESRYRTVRPTETNVLPICGEGIFSDELTGRITDFVRDVYGAETLEENLQFIADSLGGKGTPRQVLRHYLRACFFHDHCRIYQRRPIYWLFRSGRKNAFLALVYVHRWREDTLETIRTDYVLKLQAEYERQLAQAEPASPQSRAIAEQLEELTAYEAKLRRLAQGHAGIDSDDGIRANYARFAEILENIR